MESRRSVTWLLLLTIAACGGTNEGALDSARSGSDASVGTRCLVGVVSHPCTFVATPGSGGVHVVFNVTPATPIQTAQDWTTLSFAADLAGSALAIRDYTLADTSDATGNFYEPGGPDPEFYYNFELCQTDCKGSGAPPHGNFTLTITAIGFAENGTWPAASGTLMMDLAAYDTTPGHGQPAIARETVAF